MTIRTDGLPQHSKLLLTTKVRRVRRKLTKKAMEKLQESKHFVSSDDEIQQPAL